MAVRSLQQRLFTFLILSLLAVSAAFWIAIAISTSSHVNQQIQSNLDVAEKVFNQLLQEREQQLINSGLVLTDDFGFKQAVATSDNATIKSALKNHGAELNDICYSCEHSLGPSAKLAMHITSIQALSQYHFWPV